MTVRHDPNHLYRASSPTSVTRLRFMAYDLEMEAISRHNAPKKSSKVKPLSSVEQLLLDGFLLAIDIIIEQGGQGITGAKLGVQLKKRMPVLDEPQVDLVMSNVYHLVPRTLNKSA